MPHRIGILRVDDRLKADEDVMRVGAIHVGPTEETSTLLLDIVQEKEIPADAVKSWPIGEGRALVVSKHKGDLRLAGRPALRRLGLLG